MDFEISNFSAFAKMLARENINISIDEDADTAYFDLKSRSLHLPKWEGMDRPTLRMLIGHEVSHALYTPFREWQDALKKFPDDLEKQFFQGYLNVIEDCRIDKLIQRRYPGIKRDYIHAAKFLIDKDFFGIKDKKIDELPFIDRINVKYKTHWLSVGAIKVNFSSEETPYLLRIDNLETWKEVEDLATELFQKYKEDPQSNFGSIREQYDQASKELREQILKDLEKFFKGAYKVINGDINKSTGKPITLKEAMEGAETTPGQKGSLSPQPHPGMTYDEMQDSMNNQDPLVGSKNDHDGTGVAIVKSNKVKDFYREDWTKNSSYQQKAPLNVKQIYQDNKFFVNKFVSYFNSMKRGREFSRIKESKTGVLDVNKLHQYEYAEEIFSTIETTNQQKNHGFIVIVDCSGSMDSIFTKVLQQLFIFTNICEKLNIPFISVGFSDCFDGQGKKINTFSGHNNISLQKFYDSREPRKDNNERMSKVNSMRLGGTPLSDALYLSSSLIEEFRQVHNVDILNVIVMTDGGDGTYANNQFIQDQKTKTMVRCEVSPRGCSDNMTGTIKLLKKLHNVRVTYFDIVDRINGLPNLTEKDKSFFAANKFIAKKNHMGIDNVVFISNSAIGDSNSKITRVLADTLA